MTRVDGVVTLVSSHAGPDNSLAMGLYVGYVGFSTVKKWHVCNRHPSEKHTYSLKGYYLARKYPAAFESTPFMSTTACVANSHPAPYPPTPTYCHSHPEPYPLPPLPIATEMERQPLPSHSMTSRPTRSPHPIRTSSLPPTARTPRYRASRKRACA